MVKVSDGITYTSLWNVQDITTIEMAREQVMNRSSVRQQAAIVVISLLPYFLLTYLLFNRRLGPQHICLQWARP